MEDGITLAVTLELSGKSKVPLAVRTWEKLRYEYSLFLSFPTSSSIGPLALWLTRV